MRCVVQAVPGLGNPPLSGAQSAASNVAIPEVVMPGATSASQTSVTFRTPAGFDIDTAFLITAFC